MCALPYGWSLLPRELELDLIKVTTGAVLSLQGTGWLRIMEIVGGQHKGRLSRYTRRGSPMKPTPQASLSLAGSKSPLASGMALCRLCTCRRLPWPSARLGRHCRLLRPAACLSRVCSRGTPHHTHADHAPSAP